MNGKEEQIKFAIFDTIELDVKKLIKFVNLLLQKTRRKVVEEIIGKLKRQSYLFGHKWQVPSNKRYTAYCPKCQKVC